MGTRHAGTRLAVIAVDRLDVRSRRFKLVETTAIVAIYGNLRPRKTFAKAPARRSRVRAFQFTLAMDTVPATRGLRASAYEVETVLNIYR
jgi:hypothetical protein